MKKSESTPPSHLSAATRTWWCAIIEDFELERHHMRLLLACSESWDRAETARRAVKSAGMFYEDRFGAPKAHPGVDVERKSRDQFRLLLRELGLDVEPPAESRMAGRTANAHLRLAK